MRADGWEVMNALPADTVDHLGNANDLSRFADATFDAIYASHVLEHFDYQRELGDTLREWCRVLKPGGELLISVPDLEVLAELLLDKRLAPAERFMAMRMMFGGHVDAYDYHGVGLTAEFLQAYLGDAGFASMQRVERFGLFADTSDYRFAGRCISLNVRAVKLADPRERLRRPGYMSAFVGLRPADLPLTEGVEVAGFSRSANRPVTYL